MECVAVIAVSAAVIFARLAIMQELNPLLWGTLAVAIYAGAPAYMIWRGAGWALAPWVWASSFGGLFALLVVQSVVAARRRFGGRGGGSAARVKAPRPGERRGKRRRPPEGRGRA